MKTIDEWAAVWIKREVAFNDFVKAIQDEAYHEGQLAGLQMGKETALKTIEEVFSKPAERSENV